MALYSFITKKCNADLQKYGLVDSVRKYAAKIEYDQSTGSVDLYPHPFLKRNVRKHYRLIIEERRLGDDVLYCFLCVFLRSDSEYAQFMNLSTMGKLHLFSEKYSPSQQEIKNYLTERRAQNRVEPLPGLTPLEHTYLMGLTSPSDRPEQSIIESRTWVERISRNIKPELRSGYFQLIEKLLWSNDLDPTHTVIGNGKYWILYRYFPKVDKLFLVAPLEPKVREKDEADLRKRYERIFTANERTVNLVIREEGLRSYPGIVTADQELWLDIQESKEANLSLSPEEMDVLNSVLNPSSSGANTEQQAMYPLFINGRPGSGKSTILLYLFAEHLHFHLKQIWAYKTTRGVGVLEKPPIYLTYSEGLLRDARHIVHDILRCDGVKAQSLYELNDSEIKQTIENSFAHFRTFFCSALPVLERTQFDPQYFVDFPHFRRIFLERTAQDANSNLRTLSPEIAWHVIRTYIKGMRQQSNVYLDVDVYEHELPRKQQSVTRSTFELVYNEVWEKFYRPYCEGEGYWDDQDLARKLLDLAEGGRIDLSQFPAIFCDESQDFTKIELELVFKLSLFSKRSIKLNELHSVLPRIPFAFAGDPFQTLNPTGFDWDATKAFFHNSLVRPLDPAGRADLTFNYKELEFNYRSAQPIVQFCNLIQLMRGRAFNIKGIKPQKTWQVRPALHPVYYDIAQPGCQQAMQTQQALIYMVPCQEGEEELYVQQDTFLKRIAWNEEEGHVTKDVLSPGRAKGLQFQRVVLYKFGEHALNSYESQINLLLDPFIDNTPPPKEDTLPLEYFVNHLYVAASRPRLQLIIVDTQRALDKFWAFAIEGDQQALIYSYPTNQEWNQDHITLLVQGTRESWYQIKEDALTLGHNFFVKGQEKRDPYFLDRANQNFLAAGDRERADHALALKYFYQGKLKEAGVIYSRLKKYKNALACFWQSKNYNQIVELQPEVTTDDPKHALIFHAARYMAGDREIHASLDCIERIYSAFSSSKEIEQSILKDSHWAYILQDCVQELTQHIEQDENTQIPVQEWKKSWAHLSELLASGIEFTDKVKLALIACVAEDYNASRELLDENGESLPPSKGWKARVYAESSAYPEKIYWLSQLSLSKQVIETYNAQQEYTSKGQPLSESDAQLVFEACVYEEEYEQARTFLVLYPTEERYRMLFSELLEKELYHLANQSLLDLIQFYLLSGKWSEVLQLALSLPALPDAISDKNHQLLIDPAKAHAFLIRKLARSETLQRELSLRQRHSISEYLNMQLVNPSPSIQALVPLEEAGAAFERASIFKDTLNFYDSIISYTQDEHADLKRWTELRWVKTKLRQASSMATENQRNDALKIATSKMHDWQLPKNVVQTAPNYPLLDPIQDFVLPVEEAPIPAPITMHSSNEHIQIDEEPSSEADYIVHIQESEKSLKRALPAWKEIPNYANSNLQEHKISLEDELQTQESTASIRTSNGSSSTSEESVLTIDAYAPAEPDQPVIHDVSTSKYQEPPILEDSSSAVDQEDATSDNAGEALNQEVGNEGKTEDIQHDQEELTSEFVETTDTLQASLEDAIERVEQIEEPILPESNIVSTPSPAIRIPDNGSPSSLYVQDIPVQVSLTLQVGNHTFDGQLIQQVRVLELRHRITQARVDILASVLEVRDSYGVLNIELLDSDSLTSVSWMVPEWSLLICLEEHVNATNISFLHASSGKAILHLQL